MHQARQTNHRQSSKLITFTLLTLFSLFVGMGCQKTDMPLMTERPSCGSALKKATPEYLECILSQDSHDRSFGRELTEEEIETMTEASYAVFSSIYRFEDGELSEEDANDLFEKNNAVCEPIVGQGCFETFFTRRGDSQETKDITQDALQQIFTPMPGL